jgi:hypothetical protein
VHYRGGGFLCRSVHRVRRTRGFSFSGPTAIASAAPAASAALALAGCTAFPGRAVLALLVALGALLAAL